METMETRSIFTLKDALFVAATGAFHLVFVYMDIITIGEWSILTYLIFGIIAIVNAIQRSASILIDFIGTMNNLTADHRAKMFKIFNDNLIGTRCRKR